MDHFYLLYLQCLEQHLITNEYLCKLVSKGSTFFFWALFHLHLIITTLYHSLTMLCYLFSLRDQEGKAILIWSPIPCSTENTGAPASLVLKWPCRAELPLLPHDLHEIFRVSKIENCTIGIVCYYSITKFILTISVIIDFFLQYSI